MRSQNPPDLDRRSAFSVVGGTTQAADPLERALRPPVGLKGAMRQLVGGVSVVTAGTGPERTGATVTSAQSFAIDPETVVVSINLSSSTWPAIRRHGAFCVNVLAADQRAIAERFAGRTGVKGAERYLGASWTSLVTGAGALEGALASIDCEVEDAIERHSHALIFGAVRAVATREGDALVYSQGRYGAYKHGGTAEP